MESCALSSSCGVCAFYIGWVCRLAALPQCTGSFVPALDPALILFAKTPVPGAVKTRLQPQLDASQAARVAELLIEQTVVVARHWPGPVSLAVWPQEDHPLFHRLRQEYALPIQRQSAGDLGHKMDDALTGCIQLGRPAAIMGCDVPHCPPEVLLAAATELDNGQPVLGPSTDGGYYLIGLTKPNASLFVDIAWGTNAVLAQTLQRASAAGVTFKSLPELTDLDSWSDLIKLTPTIPGLAALMNKI